MRFSARIDARRTTAEFKQARIEINKRVRTGLTNCVERIALPRVRLLARVPPEVKAALIAKATGTRGYISTRGPRRFDRILGLLNFGGTVHGTIRPTHRPKTTHAPAVKTPQGFRAAVHGPRHYRPRHFMEHAVESALPQYEAEMLNEVMRMFHQ